jgi:hypothetical protein
LPTSRKTKHVSSNKMRDVQTLIQRNNASINSKQINPSRHFSMSIPRKISAITHVVPTF